MPLLEVQYAQLQTELKQAVADAGIPADSICNRLQIVFEVVGSSEFYNAGDVAHND